MLSKLVKMNDNRLTKFVFLWDLDQSVSFRNWSYEVKQILESINMTNFNTKTTVDINVAKNLLFENFKNCWKSDCSKKPKLRTYFKFKHEYKTECYISLNLPRQLRSILAQLRLGILPLYIETGRYQTKIDPVTGKRRNLKSEERLCELCDTNSVEDEFHFIFCCNFYINERKYYFDKICKQNPKFQEMDNTNKIIYLFEYDCKNFARFVTHIWNKRKERLYV